MRCRAQRLGQFEVGNRQRHGRQGRRGVTGARARVSLAAGQRGIGEERPKCKAQSECGADQRHAPRPLVQRGRIGDVSLGRRDGGARDARSDAGHKQPGNAPIHRGHAEQGIKQNRPAEPDHQHGAATDPVGQSAPERSKQELHGRKTGHQQPQLQARLVERELFGINRQQRYHHAEAQQVDKDRQENDQQRTATGTFGHGRIAGSGGNCRVRDGAGGISARARSAESLTEAPGRGQACWLCGSAIGSRGLLNRRLRAGGSTAGRVVSSR